MHYPPEETRKDQRPAAGRSILSRAQPPESTLTRFAAEVRMVGRNVLEGRWTFQVIEEYDDNYDQLFRQLEQQAREEFVSGRRHLTESEMKEWGRTHGEIAHAATP